MIAEPTQADLAALKARIVEHGAFVAAMKVLWERDCLDGKKAGLAREEAKREAEAMVSEYVEMAGYLSALEEAGGTPLEDAGRDAADREYERATRTPRAP